MPKSSHGEVPAMGMVEKALEPLKADERARVLRWAAERFDVVPPQGPKSPAGGAHQKPNAGLDEPPPEDAGEFYARADAKTDVERALVVAYWVQEVQGNSNGQFDAQTVNTQLKNLGHGVGNITVAFNHLKKQKPQPIIQLQKSGKSKQARKTYKVTAAGKTQVQKMLAGNHEE